MNDSSSIEKTDERDFEQLFDTYYAPFYLYAKRFLDEEEVCQDLVSDVFANLWLKREEVEITSRVILGYLKTAVKNACLNHIKHNCYIQDYSSACQQKTPIYASSPDAVYNLKELYALLYASLEKLPEEQRQVFIKKVFEGKSRSEIADDLDISVKTVDRYKQKAMEQISKECKDYLPLLLSFLFFK
ncbi:MAG: RNA polymerase sigma-70 factor [Bacteroidaceae bacterium]|nr:RNA polymerase sigma-70 factor [Bacteroidaceae bacterium]